MTLNGLFLLLPTQQPRERKEGNIISNLVYNFARIEVIHDKLYEQHFFSHRQ